MKFYLSGRAAALAAQVTLSSDGRTATLNPNKNMRAGKTYRARLSSAITDRSGNALTALSWSSRAR